MSHARILLKDFSGCVNGLTAQVRESCETRAKDLGLEVRYVMSIGVECAILFTGTSLDSVLTYLKEKIIKNILPVRSGRHYERRFTQYKLPKFCTNKRSLA